MPFIWQETRCSIQEPSILLLGIRGWIKEGEISLEKIDTKGNPANFITKFVPKEKFELCSNAINVIGY